jgi:hypothetical protein
MFGGVEARRSRWSIQLFQDGCSGGVSAGWGSGSGWYTYIPTCEGRAGRDGMTFTGTKAEVEAVRLASGRCGWRA